MVDILLYKFDQYLVNGGYSLWSSWGSCSHTCGIGKKSRSRSCTFPKPMHGGNDCTGLGESVDLTDCIDGPCPGNQ